MENYNNLTQDELNDEFIDACYDGNLSKVRYLLTSPELKEHADIHACNDDGFIWACQNGHLDVVKYLLISSELKEHVDIHTDNDNGFRLACYNKHMEVVRFLIFDMSIEKTNDIEFLKNDKYQEIENLFKIRELKGQLENKLDPFYNNKKNKI